MKTLLSFALIVLTANVAFAGAHHKPHLMPDATSEEYRAALAKHPKSIFFNVSGAVQDAITHGEKNMNWLKHMNSFRKPDNQLRLTKPGDLKGHPIETPSKYSPEIVEADLAQLKLDMPQALKAILLDGGALTQNPPTDDETYIIWAKKVDRLYQTATRWTLLAPYLPQMKAEKQNDVRGYYFLVREADLEKKLRDFSNLPALDQTRLSGLLETLCQNTEGVTTRCGRSLQTAVNSKKVFEFYTKYHPGGENLWKGFFAIQNPRKELVWNAQNPNLAVLPFKTPTIPEITDFLAVNISDEWKWNGWQLRLDFTPTADVHVRFVPGTTPNVNGLGGNRITMDANAPLTEWDVQWTIRHEFGHVLGFPDCYIEFFDTVENAMINYQIDVDNMMCSRKGRMQEKHFEEMKLNYYK